MCVTTSIWNIFGVLLTDWPVRSTWDVMESKVEWTGKPAFCQVVANRFYQVVTVSNRACSSHRWIQYTSGTRVTTSGTYLQMTTCPMVHLGRKIPEEVLPPIIRHQNQLHTKWPPSSSLLSKPSLKSRYSFIHSFIHSFPRAIIFF
jgi:hypothetical protein